MAKQERTGTLIVTVYSHIEAYPPSLNALYHLATIFDKVIVLVPNVMESKWVYPKNVTLDSFGAFVAATKVKDKAVISKVEYFIRYGIHLRGLIRTHKPRLVLAYDPSSFSLVFLFAGGFLRKYKIPVWYHNHDVADEKELPKYSLMWFSRYLELKYFSRIDFFSIPNEVRLKFFPVSLLRRPPTILPNYPSKYLYGRSYESNKLLEGKIKMIFQGQIGSGNSIESFIRILKFKINSLSLELHLAGPIQEGYRLLLESLATEEEVSDKVIIHGLLPYGDLPALTSMCHVGIAIYGTHNTMVRNMSTASNKIFEYASLGLPVVINARSDMQEEFGGDSWIHFTELDELSILKSLETIAVRYGYFSREARLKFEKRLNFEAGFIPFLNDLRNTIYTN